MRIINYKQSTSDVYKIQRLLNIKPHRFFTWLKADMNIKQNIRDAAMRTINLFEIDYNRVDFVFKDNLKGLKDSEIFNKNCYEEYLSTNEYFTLMKNIDKFNKSFKDVQFLATIIKYYTARRDTGEYSRKEYKRRLNMLDDYSKEM